jgi:NDP-sugar pyrophosphorylase family protein
MGTRMAQSGGRMAKPLMRVAGATLLERNIRQLVRHGFDAIVVVVARAARDVADHVRNDLMEPAAALGCRIEVVAENQPLGNFGAVRMLRGRGGPAVIVYADNVTALDLRAIRKFHVRSRAAMTIATHRQHFTMPFGEVTLDASRVLAYREKPRIDFCVCSAVCVVGEQAAAMIADGEALGLSQMVQRLIARGMAVHAFAHDDPWLDVNDLDAVGRAAALVRAYPERFERWTDDDLPIAGTVRIAHGDPSFMPAAIDLFDRDRQGFTRWRLEHGKPRPNAAPDRVIAYARAFAGAVR